MKVPARARFCTRAGEVRAWRARGETALELNKTRLLPKVNFSWFLGGPGIQAAEVRNGRHFAREIGFIEQEGAEGHRPSRD